MGMGVVRAGRAWTNKVKRAWLVMIKINKEVVPQGVGDISLELEQ